MKQKVFIGLSGGVDSSVSAALLKKQGYDIFGVFIKAWEDTKEFGGECPWEEDQKEVEKVCKHLKIPWETWNFEKEYSERVLGYFFREYESGRTPNPDVMCNKEIKFSLFLETAIKKGAEYIATGHYARVSKEGKEYSLLKGLDNSKDQSYFLYTLGQKQLSKILFPIGDMLKSEVRELAKKFDLPNYSRKDSQGICFIGNVKVREFLKSRIKPQKGKIVTETGEVVGEHDGQAFFTIGQRHGVGVGGGVPYYVAKKNPKTNTIVVAKGNRDDILYGTDLSVEGINWTNHKPSLPINCKAKIRYRQPDQNCTISQVNGTIIVKFKKKQRAITPGQSIVFYNGEVVLGGGIIS